MPARNAGLMSKVRRGHRFAPARRVVSGDRLRPRVESLEDRWNPTAGGS